MEQICLEGAAGYAGIASGIVVVASMLANLVKADSVLGKIMNYLALNIKVGKK
jgi:hypothetical protein